MILALGSSGAEVDPKYYAVMMNASVQNSPAQITLHWTADPAATGYTISRKAKTASSWSTLGSVGGGVNSYTDSNVAVGQEYEYCVTKSASTHTGRGYLLAGINAPLKDIRGKMILLVDNTFSTTLANELKSLEWDLAGDGWTVIRRDISRTLTPPQVKAVIKGEYNADPSNVKAVFIFGHVAVPYSGNFGPDGHHDHQGAWAADTYYADMDGNWTDSSVYNVSGQRPATHNVPGDGKFDQSEIPSNLELAVGRVDMYKLTCFSNKAWSRSETDLLRAYIAKDHNFRHRVFTPARRGLVCDNFGERGGEAFASSGWRNFGSFFGGENVTAAASGGFFNALRTTDYLWSYGTGGGGYTSCAGVGGSDDFALTEVKTVFTMYLGSYFGDWDNESAFLRAALASGWTLTTSWAGRPHWFYHHMGLGEHIGYSAIASQNNPNGGTYQNTLNTAARGVHTALLGDPTLRMHPVIPPTNLRGTASGSSMALMWDASTDSDLVGYHIYRGTGPNNGFTRVTSSPVAATVFTDNAYSSGVVYMVRAVKLERAGGGTYYNASQGAFYGNTSGSGGTTGGTTGSNPAPTAPTSLTATTASASQINLSWVDNSNNETGFVVSRKTGVSGAWSEVATLAANSTSYNNTGLGSATLYFYRVSAAGASGNSTPSGEASATTLSGAPVSAAATFLRTDTTTQGNWIGNYGADGYVLSTRVPALPGYAAVTASGKTDYEWSDSTTEVRALRQPSGSARLAACWYSPSTYNVDLALTDGNSHRMAIYFLDWDRAGRSARVEIIDTASGAVLDTRTISSFAEGKYLVWNVRGAVRVRLTNLGGPNVLNMGIFFDSAEAAATVATPKPIYSGGMFTLRITGTAGQKFEILATDNFASWTSLGVVTMTSPSLDYRDTSSAGKTSRMYRLKSVP